VSAERRRAERRGRRAETLAALRLQLGGWRILARRWRGPGDEIDLIAKRGRVVAFVEVKRRGDHDVARAAVTARQRRRIGDAAAAFLAVRPDLRDCAARFDVVTVAGLRPPRRIVDAWRL